MPFSFATKPWSALKPAAEGPDERSFLIIRVGELSVEWCPYTTAQKKTETFVSVQVPQSFGLNHRPRAGFFAPPLTGGVTFCGWIGFAAAAAA